MYIFNRTCQADSMPVRRSYKKRAPAVRRTRRTRRRGTRTNKVVSRSSPIPDRFITRMKYSELMAMITAGIGVPSYQQFRVNSIFDPNLTGVGHQPLGHDQFALLYNKYVVLGMSYVITLTNQSTTDYADVCVVQHPNSTLCTSIGQAMESPYSRRGILGPETGSRNILVLKGYCSVAKIRGITVSKVKTEDNLAALFGANPAITPCLTVYIENQNVAAAITVNARFDITYHVQAYDRVQLGQS